MMHETLEAALETSCFLQSRCALDGNEQGSKMACNYLHADQVSQPELPSALDIS